MRKAPTGTVLADGDSVPHRNPWNRVILVLVAIALLGGLALTALPVGPLRESALWLNIVTAGLMIVAGVGWAYTEIRYQERVSERDQTDRQRIAGYLGALGVTAVIAVCGALVPARLVPYLYILFVPMLLAVWWLRNRRRRSVLHTNRRH